MNSREKEIRKILNGYFLLNDENLIEEGEDLRDIQNLQGNAISSGIVGLKSRMIQYHSALSNEELMEACPEILLKYGLPVLLHTAPDAFTILVDAGFVDTYMMTVEISEQDLLICLYKVRNLFAGWRFKRLERKWLRRFETLSLTEVPITLTPQLLVSEEDEKKTIFKRRKSDDEKEDEE